MLIQMKISFRINPSRQGELAVDPDYQTWKQSLSRPKIDRGQKNLLSEIEDGAEITEIAGLQAKGRQVAWWKYPGQRAIAGPIQISPASV